MISFFCLFSIKVFLGSCVCVGDTSNPLGLWCCLIQIDVCSNKLLTCLICLSFSDRGKGFRRKESRSEPKNKMRRWGQAVDHKKGCGEPNGEGINWSQWQGGRNGGVATNDSRGGPSSKDRVTGKQADLRGPGQVSPWPLFQGQWFNSVWLSYSLLLLPVPREQEIWP